MKYARIEVTPANWLAISSALQGGPRSSLKFTSRERLEAYLADLEARDWYRKSAEAWRRIPNQATISASGFACGNPRDVARMISLCNAALQERSDR